jgi:hypothetical protein
MLSIPLQPIPAQVFTIALNKQRCRITIQQRHAYPAGRRIPALYLTLEVNDRVIIAGVPCITGVMLVRDPYLGFKGELAWFDLEGKIGESPQASGLGTRWFLIYADPP